MKIIIFTLCVIGAIALHLPQSHLAATFPTGPVTLKSEVGTYLARCSECGSGTYPDSAGVYEKNPTNPWAIWTVQVIGDKIALKADNGKYLSRCNSCWTTGSVYPLDSVFVQASTPVGNLAAQWTPQDLGNGKWGLKGENGKYLGRCNGCVFGNNIITDFAMVNVDTVMNNGYAQWIVQKSLLFPLGSVSVRSDNGNYLGRCYGCGPGSFPDAASVHHTTSNVWTTWVAQRVGDNIAFKADNGKYLARCIDCWTQGTSGGSDSAFVTALTPVGNLAAQWTPLDLGNGKWALKGDNGKFLNRCYQCVVGGIADNFAFVSAITYLNTPTAQWTVEKPSTFPLLFQLGSVNVRSDNGNYLGRCYGCGPGSFPDAASVHHTTSNVWTIWIAQRVGDKVAFKADNGKYLARCLNCWPQGTSGGNDSAFVTATTPYANPAVLWTPQDAGNGKWALKGDNGKFLNRCYQCVVGGIADNFAFVSATSYLNLPTAQWTVEKPYQFPLYFPLGSVSVRSDNGNYLGRCYGCGPGSFPDAASVHHTTSNVWTTWIAQRFGDKITFKADNGKYLARCSNCWTQGASGGTDSAFVQISNPIGNPAAQWAAIDLGNGKWALKGDNGKFLNRCYQCVVGGIADNFAFVSAITYLNTPTAIWTIKN